MAAEKTAFVTGGSGFLGKNLVPLLCAEEWDVTILHRTGSDISGLRKLPVRLAKGDILQVDSLIAAIPAGCQVVFHLAGSTNTWRGRNDIQTAVNVVGSRNIVAAAASRRVRRIVATSSIAAYGDQRGILTEETPSKAPGSWVNYYRSKWEGEQEIKRGAEAGIETVILNPGPIIGPHDTSGWARFFRLVRDDSLPAVPPGRASFCSSVEAARAHIRAAEKGRPDENYILGGTNASFLDFVRVVCGLLGKPAPRKATHPALFTTLAILAEIAGALSGKEPLLTRENASLLSKEVTCFCEKAVRELDFRILPL